MVTSSCFEHIYSFSPYTETYTTLNIDLDIAHPKCIIKAKNKIYLFLAGINDYEISTKGEIIRTLPCQC